MNSVVLFYLTSVLSKRPYSTIPVLDLLFHIACCFILQILEATNVNGQLATSCIYDSEGQQLLKTRNDSCLQFSYTCMYNCITSTRSTASNVLYNISEVVKQEDLYFSS